VKVRVWVRQSRIAGLGLFAAQDIKKWTRILPYLGEKIAKAESARRLAQGNVYIPSHRLDSEPRVLSFLVIQGVVNGSLRNAYVILHGPGCS